MRPSGRAPDALRPISLTPGYARHAEGPGLYGNVSSAAWLASRGMALATRSPGPGR